MQLMTLRQYGQEEELKMLFYFTGTGNTLYVAKQLEEKPVSIPQVIRNENLDFTAESIGRNYRCKQSNLENFIKYIDNVSE